VEQADATRLMEQRQQELADSGQMVGLLTFEYRPEGFFSVVYSGARRHRQATLAPEEMASDRWREILESRLGLG
jgi:hypothetical protein